MRRPPNLMKSVTAPVTVQAEAKPPPPANYLDLYGLSKPPFDGGANNAGYILFGSHRRPFELLIDHVVNGTGVIVLQGGEGIGKTETLRSLADLAAESGQPTIMITRPPNDRISLEQLVSKLRGDSTNDGATIDDVIADFVAPPRKALLVDDVDLMPGDCVRLLSALVQQMPNDPGGPAIVLSSSAVLPTDPMRPDLSQLVDHVRNTVRLLPLGSAEVQQYIERSLWIAGGTTRRLIAADAMRLLIARSGGVPGATNRLMEAVLTAGFARGDSMITAKTVAAVTGPTTPRPQPRPRSGGPPSGIAERAMQIVAIGLLVLGVSAFLYKGFNGQADHHSAVSAKPVAPEAHLAQPVTIPPVQPRPPPAKPAEILPPELMAALMKRGDESLGLGDIAAARMLYQRAAEAGNAAAATALGKTYDPNFVVPGGPSDPARAADWYKKAITLGDRRAVDLLRHLAGRS
jgi:type II secretory pathway predicted ATPase ExeA